MIFSEVISSFVMIRVNLNYIRIDRCKVLRLIARDDDDE